MQEVSRRSSPQKTGCRMNRKINRPPSKDELKELMIAAFAAGVVITAAYFILFILK
jgi:hypothetical protein